MDERAFAAAWAAIGRGDLDELRALLASRPELARARLGDRAATLLHHAAYKNSVAACRLLLAAGSSLTALQGEGLEGQTPLALALECNGVDAAAFLAEIAVVPNCLWVAASFGRCQWMAEFFDAEGQLEERAADPNKSSEAGFVLADALVAAAHHRHNDAALMLLDKGADPSGRDHFGMTALHYAAIGNLPLAEALVGRGANARQRDLQFDATPYGWAKFHEAHVVVEYLEKHADLDPRDLADA
ncbi:MAG: ankyrin repeat domain-containing protein [Planctomycetota bacterium]